MPIPSARTALSLVVWLFGAASVPLTAGSDYSAAELQRDINAAIASNADSFTVRGGRYMFNSRWVLV